MTRLLSRIELKNMILIGALLLGLMVTACSNGEDTSSVLERQREHYIFEGGLLYLIVETDKTVYEYDDFICITATLINRSDETITFYTQNTPANMHRGLTINVEKNGYKMIDVDLYKARNVYEESYFSLYPNERYVQNIRLSTRSFLEYYGDISNKVFLQEYPPSGVYDGSVSVIKVSGSEHILFIADFQVEIMPYDGSMNPFDAIDKIRSSES